MVCKADTLRLFELTITLTNGLLLLLKTRRRLALKLVSFGSLELELLFTLLTRALLLGGLRRGLLQRRPLRLAVVYFRLLGFGHEGVPAHRFRPFRRFYLQGLIESHLIHARL